MHICLTVRRCYLPKCIPDKWARISVLNFGENLFDRVQIGTVWCMAKNGQALQNHKHVPQLLGHDVLGDYLLGKAQAFELLFTRILLHAIGRLWGRWLAKFAQLILTHYNKRSRVFAIKSLHCW